MNVTLVWHPLWFNLHIRRPHPTLGLTGGCREILDFATEVFAEKGYEGASMRDLSRLSGISLAGLVLLLRLQGKAALLHPEAHLHHHPRSLAGTPQPRNDPEQRIRIFVHNHVEYALARHNAMKVLSHEDDVLKNGYRAELAAIKRSYYRICVGLVEDLDRQERRNGSRPRRADYAYGCDVAFRRHELAVHVAQSQV